ncbi:diablo IAP-binding mitochondrial protein-like [Periophthalmus magnuspinnatus]|uniref:diablo IAP-binding mitochondrial protein-like n=1 Tax=Periophthalmus magnuspinnatus TaxID=409849 RepID=UPI00145B4581|nr:diablo IAP-binding mitochondrial protein-like [Periophthalmus magnuspinnatus]
MQAVRCSACAGRIAGVLQRQMSKRFTSSDTGVFSILKPSSQKLQETPNNTHMSRASLSVGLGLNTVPFSHQVENLSHDFLIRKAASVVTDSSSTFLSQTTLALIDSLTDYAKAVHTRIALQRQYLATLGKLSPAEDDSLWQLINNLRAQAADRLSQCKHFESTWINAMNMSKMAAEAAYVSGAEQASITIRTNIQLAQSQVDEAKKVSTEADKKLAETKADEIQRMAEYHAFLQNSEHEVHEAYLRED